MYKLYIIIYKNIFYEFAYDWEFWFLTKNFGFWSTFSIFLEIFDFWRKLRPLINTSVAKVQLV